MFRQLQMPQQPSQPQHRDGQEPVVQFQKVNGCDFENDWLSCCFYSLAADYMFNSDFNSTWLLSV